MARTGKNGYGEPRPYILCIGCKQLLRQNNFSYKVKGDSSQGVNPRCKSCSAKRAEYVREQRKHNWKYNPTKHMFHNSRQRAKRTGLEHTITINDIIIPDYCPVFGIKLETGDRKDHNNAPSIDRIDNNRGYVKDNIIIVSTRANILKKDATIDEIIMLAKFYSGLKEI